MESIQQKRERLLETIKSCEQEINNPNEFSSPAMVNQFRKGLAEAQRQLNELNKTQPAQQTAPIQKIEQRPNVVAKEADKKQKYNVCRYGYGVPSSFEEKRPKPLNPIPFAPESIYRPQPAQQTEPAPKVEQQPNEQAQERLIQTLLKAPLTSEYTPELQPVAPTPNVPAQDALKPKPEMQDTIGDPSVGKPKIPNPAVGIIGGKMSLLNNAPFFLNTYRINADEKQKTVTTATGVPVIEQDDSSTDTIASTIHTCNNGGSLVVKIVWVGGITEVLLEGECRSKFTTRLADCANSKSAMIENWEKLRLSNGFRKMVAYYKALSHYPRPSNEKWPNIGDIGNKYFVSKARKKLWFMIQEEIFNQENAAKQ